MPEFSIATKAIIFNPKTNKYLVLFKSDQEDVNPNSYDFPGGRVKFGEKLEEAVVREALEETGLDVTPIQVFNAWTFVRPNAGFQLTGIDFIYATGSENVFLSPEHSGFGWLDSNQITSDEKYPDWLRKTIKKASKLNI